jgi:hypothetical protein
MWGLNMNIDIDEVKWTQSESALWLQWTLATAAGMLAGFLPFLLLMQFIPLAVARLIFPIWAGLFVGLFQWFVLRRCIAQCGDWIWNGVAGWALGYALGLMVIQVFSVSFLGALVGYFLFGAIVALIQWPILHRKIPHVMPWVLASVAGWALGALSGQAVLNLLVPAGQPIPQAVSTFVIAGTTGLVAGAVTGLALVYIIRQPEV